MTGSIPALRAIATSTRSTRMYIVAVLVVMTALAAAWSVVAKQQLLGALAVGDAESLDRAHAVFDMLRGRTQASLRSQCGVLAEDPRLKATLATEGIDETSVADVLRELGRLRRTGVLLVMTPEGRVFAQAGADELRGLDLSASSVMKRARSSREPVAGSWVIGGKIIDLAATAIQFNDSVLAYLVVGEAVDGELVNAVTRGTGVGLAVIAGGAASLMSTTDGKLRAVLESLTHDAGIAPARAVELDGVSYLVATVELEDIAQSHPRLALVRAPALQLGAFEIIKWLLWTPIGLAIMGVVLARQRTSCRAL
jgi:hypothetical protein